MNSITNELELLPSPEEQQADMEKQRRSELYNKIIDHELGITCGDVIRAARDEQVGLARLLAAKCNGRFAAEMQAGSQKHPQVYAYNGVYWELDSQRSHADLDIEFIEILSMVSREIATLKDGGRKKFLDYENKIIQAALKSARNINTFKAITRRAFEGGSGCGVPSDLWDQDKFTLTTSANVVDLSNGSIIPPRVEDYRRRHTNVEYFEDADEPKLFLNALSEIFSLIGRPDEPTYADDSNLKAEMASITHRGFSIGDEEEQLAQLRESLAEVERTNDALRMDYEQRLADWTSGKVLKEFIEFFQALLGYCILGTNQSEKFIVFMGAKGRNGKGVICQTLEKILGSYVNDVRAETFMKGKKRGGGDATSDIMALKGLRIIFISENDRGDAIDASLIKRITGHDKISGRELYGVEQTFAPCCVPILMTNFFPYIDSEDHALLRRCICIPFLRTFKEVPNPDEPTEGKMDVNLKDALASEFPQILSWLVRGAVRVQQEGLKIPDYIEATAEEFRKDKDILGTFLAEICTTEDFIEDTRERKRFPAEESGSRMYYAYAQWCFENNINPLSNPVFKQRMIAKGYNHGKISLHYYKGIRFKNARDSDHVYLIHDGDSLYEAYMERTHRTR